MILIICRQCCQMSNILYKLFGFSGLLAILEESRDNPHPKAYRLPAIFDIKQWIGPETADVHGHVKPYCFKFIRDSDGKANRLYRKWSHEKWMGPVQMLKVHNCMHKIIVHG